MSIIKHSTMFRKTIIKIRIKLQKSMNQKYKNF